MIPICLYFERFIPYYDQRIKKEEIVDDIKAFLFERTATTAVRAGLFSLAVYGLTFLGPPPLNLLEMLPLWLTYIIFFLIADFGAYWEHRWLHANSFLWKGHITHHIVNKNYFLNEYHRHPFGYLLYLPFVIIPLWLLGANEQFFIYLAVFVVFCNYFQHINADIRLGPFNYIFSFAPVHKFHHSTDQAHADGNFGHNLIIYDILFGTFINPKNHSYPVEMGLYAEVPGYPKIGFFRQIAAPFIRSHWRD
jgi:sterol desaturase/sphingolipid hydroxylase (fatty acid hydroxylase superfamily)